MYARAHTHTHAHARTHIYTRARTHTYNKHTCTHAHARAHARTHAHAGTEAVSTPREALVAPPQISRHEVCLPTSAPGLGLPHLHRDWAHPVHICTGTALTATTSASGVGSPLSHLCCQWTHPCLHLHRGWGLSLPTHICAGTQARRRGERALRLLPRRDGAKGA
jgi:hypothetical protein